MLTAVFAETDNVDVVLITQVQISECSAYPLSRRVELDDGSLFIQVHYIFNICAQNVLGDAHPGFFLRQDDCVSTDRFENFTVILVFCFGDDMLDAEFLAVHDSQHAGFQHRTGSDHDHITV
ncbi:hypothetical protein SDC9_159495 [bioreactor metagenome]|uniref:Uncharacterized protein n=1 Tax=bioreactor metagenome TaxID=1076179 RepID=A0A645FIW1_9ZZZZ